MKKIYSEPKLTLVRFDCQDIITASLIWYGQDYPNGGNPCDGGVDAGEQIGGDWWNDP